MCFEYSSWNSEDLYFREGKGHGFQLSTTVRRLHYLSSFIYVLSTQMSRKVTHRKRRLEASRLESLTGSTLRLMACSLK